MPQRVSLAMSGKVSNRTRRRRRSFAARWQPRPPALASCDPLRLPSSFALAFRLAQLNLGGVDPAARAACSARSQSPFSALLCAAGPIFMPGIIPRCSACGSAGVCGASACRLVLTCGVSQPVGPQRVDVAAGPLRPVSPVAEKNSSPASSATPSVICQWRLAAKPLSPFSACASAASPATAPRRPARPPTAEAASSL